MKKIMIFLLISSLLLAKDINVGDLVKVKITGIEKEKIVEGFKKSNLELENIEKSENGYILSIRGYKVGENSLVLGEKKLTLNIKSVLEENDKEIYPHLNDNSDTILYKEKFPYTFIVGIILGVVSLLYLVKGIKFKKKEKYISPEERFEKRVANITNETWDFDLSTAIREYIDSRYQTHFINGNYQVIGMIDSEDIKFINNLDRYKFSKDSRNLKEETLKRVREIFEKVRGDKNV